MQALQDEEVQKKGVVMVMYCVGQERFQSDRPMKLARLLWLLPVRVTAAHFCHDGKVMKAFINLAIRAMEGFYLCRFRIHEGTYYY